MLCASSVPLLAHKRARTLAHIAIWPGLRWQWLANKYWPNITSIFFSQHPILPIVHAHGCASRASMGMEVSRSSPCYRYSSMGLRWICGAPTPTNKQCLEWFGRLKQLLFATYKNELGCRRGTASIFFIFSTWIRTGESWKPFSRADKNNTIAYKQS